MILWRRALGVILRALGLSVHVLMCGSAYVRFTSALLCVQPLALRRSSCNTYIIYGSLVPDLPIDDEACD